MNKLKWLAAAVIAFCGFMFAQDRRMPPEPVPPTAVAASCGQLVLRSFELQQAIDNFHAAGCNHIDLDYITDGFYLVRGTKILIGE